MVIDQSISFKFVGFAIAIQIILATIAFASLLIKRIKEIPQRPFIIWTMDTSKQALSAIIIHFTNVFLSIGRDKESNPCVVYFLNVMNREMEMT